MLLDDIIGMLNEEAPAEAENGTQNASGKANAEKTRLAYSDEFYARFSKPTEG